MTYVFTTVSIKSFLGISLSIEDFTIVFFEFCKNSIM